MHWLLQNSFPSCVIGLPSISNSHQWHTTSVSTWILIWEDWERHLSPGGFRLGLSDIFSSPSPNDCAHPLLAQANGKHNQDTCRDKPGVWSWWRNHPLHLPELSLVSYTHDSGLSSLFVSSTWFPLFGYMLKHNAFTGFTVSTFPSVRWALFLAWNTDHIDIRVYPHFGEYPSYLISVHVSK